MFVVDSYTQKYATYIDMPDREFFIGAINLARENVDAIKHIVDEKGLEFVKSHSPIAFISKLSKQLDIECEVPRKALNDSRARRAFIMGDVDLGEDDWGTYFDMRNNLVKLAKANSTPLLMYPTMSYPDKPRFRFVFLPKRALNQKQYYQAVKWIYDSIGCEVTDDSDFRMIANRNLPVFYSQEQCDEIYSTFEDKSLSALDNSLWKNIEVPKKYATIGKKVQAPKEFSVSEHTCTFDEQLLIHGAYEIAKTAVCQTYNRFWLLVRSLAAAEMSKGVSHDTAMKMLDIFADAAEDETTRLHWKVENRNLYENQMAQLDYEQLQRCRPLSSYYFFEKAKKFA